MPKVTVEFDSEKALRALDVTKRDMNKIAKKMMIKTFQEARKEIRAGYRGKVLRRGTGNLSKNIIIKGSNDFSGLLRVASFYASFHETGTTITAKKKYLTFQVKGNWVKVKQVTIPARPVVNPVSDKYFGSGNAAEPIMEQTMQEELNKIFLRDSGGVN